MSESFEENLVISKDELSRGGDLFDAEYLKLLKPFFQTNNIKDLQINQIAMMFHVTRPNIYVHLCLRMARQCLFLIVEAIQSRTYVIQELKKANTELTNILFYERYAEFIQKLTKKPIELINNLKSELKSNKAIITTLKHRIQNLSPADISGTPEQRDAVDRKIENLEEKIKQLEINLLEEETTKVNAVKKLEKRTKKFEQKAKQFRSDVEFEKLAVTAVQRDVDKYIKVIEDQKAIIDEMTKENQQLQQNRDYFVKNIHHFKKLYKGVIRGYVQEVSRVDKDILDVLCDYKLFYEVKQTKFQKRQNTIEKHHDCKVCKKENTTKYFSFPKAPYLEKLCYQAGFNNIWKLDPYNACDEMKKLHLKCISYLATKVKTNASLHYRHYLFSNNKAHYTDIDQRFYDTFLSEKVFVKGITYEDFKKCPTKKRTYLKYYEQLDQEGGFRNLFYDITKNAIKQVTETYKKIHNKYKKFNESQYENTQLVFGV